MRTPTSSALVAAGPHPSPPPPPNTHTLPTPNPQPPTLHTHKRTTHTHRSAPAARLPALPLPEGGLVEPTPAPPASLVCRLADDTHGYTGADLRALCREAAMCALSAAAEEAARATEAAADTQGPRGQGSSGAVVAPHAAPQGGRGDERRGEGGSEAAACAQQPAALLPGQLTAADFAAAMKRVGPSMARGSAVEFEPTRWGLACGTCMPLPMHMPPAAPKSLHQHLLPFAPCPDPVAGTT